MSEETTEASTETATEPVPVQTAFFVVVDTNGVISVHTDKIPTVTVSREATLYDVETYASQLVRNVSRLMTAQVMVQALTPPAEPTPAERVSEALQKRESE